MTATPWQEMVRLLDGRAYSVVSHEPREETPHRVAFGPGLTDAEVAGVERRFEFTFPPDLRQFLQTALPLGPKFPNWRRESQALLRSWMNAPRDELLRQVENGGFWHDDWGARPEALPEALRVASAALLAVPRLIPIYGRRLIPVEPCVAGNPVFSIHDADVAYCARDLEDCLRREFRLSGRRPWNEPEPQIRFWSSLAR